jgi:hypothetical protein
MKTIIILTILLASALLFLTSCRTGPGSDHPQPVRAKATQRGVARPYYRSDAEGSYYYTTGEVSNTDYRPTVTRSRPM